MPVSFATAVDELVETLQREAMPSARNLLVTVFGDAVAPVDAAVPVQALVRLLDGVGVNERLVRTSLARLVSDDILRNERVGRQSIYSIDPTSRSLFESADARIYRHAEPEWDGRWTLAIVDPTASTASGRNELRRELGWLGMGSVAPNVLASPSLPPEHLTSALARIGGTHQVLVTRGAAAEGALTMADDEIARRCAPTQELSDRYGEIIEWFAPIVTALEGESTPSPERCWITRLLLIAAFRRVALADPRLPERLLPAPWKGARARELAGSLYERLRVPADSWLEQTCSSPIAPWPANATMAHRFR